MHRTAVLLSALGFSLLTFGGVARAQDACYPIPKDGCPDVAGSAQEAPPPLDDVSADVVLSKPGPLPKTGSDTSSPLQIGAVALLAGGGMVFVATGRRRKSANNPS